jgi:hypothetical protein
LLIAEQLMLSRLDSALIECYDILFQSDME